MGWAHDVPPEPQFTYEDQDAVQAPFGHHSGLDAVPYESGRPSAVIAHTVKGKGVSFAEDTYLWHSNNVTDDVYERALAELGEP